MQCSVCPCPLDDPTFPLPRAKGRAVCKACFALYEAIYQNPWFIAAQTEWELYMRKIGRLRSGRDYLSDVGDDDAA